MTFCYLILDDQDARHEHFAGLYGAHKLVHVRTAEEAVEACKNQRFDCAFLDHDLGDGQKDGRWAADEIVKLPHECRPKQVIVHSSNFHGAAAMVMTFHDHGIRAAHRPSIARPGGV